ncbi:MAG: SurA N-terminal domain-containing protein [Prevotellaceae bacterium]|jgi:peptidyl-prolyl cis-trans isomerase D|nr:SurA N-terminal domain-containing protein [Prevotellaceae bacterium]
MATLERIRSKGPFLVIIIGLALFAFIIGDFLTQGSSFFNKEKTVVANIEGEKTDINDYYAKVEQLSNVFKIENRRTDLDEQTLEMIRSSVWDNLVNKTLLAAQAEKIGLTVSQDELADYLTGDNIHPIILQRPVFADESGYFSRQALANFLSMLKQQPSQNDQNYAQWQQYKSYWDYLVEEVRFSALQQKYNALLSKSLAVNNLETKLNFDAAQNLADVNYVTQSYFAISDSLAVVSDKEIETYYNAHKEWFKQDESRKLSYVVFDVRPTHKDFEEVETWINKLADEFKTTDDISGIVNQNSDVTYYADRSLYSQTTVPAYLKDFAFSGQTGEVYGPIFQDDTYTLARITEKNVIESDSVQVRFMFVAGAGSKEKADSLINVINKGGDFAELAEKFSAIPAKDNEVWLTHDMGGANKEIVEGAFSNSVNKAFSIDNAQGTQIFQVSDKTSPRNKVRLAILERKVISSDETTQKNYNQAKQFAVDAKNLDEFAAVAKTQNYNVSVAEDVLQSTNKIGTVEQSRQIVRWAFENKKGSISDVFDINNGSQYVVAAVADANNTGYRSLATISPQIKAQLVYEKKKEILAKQISDKLAQNGDLNALAAALGTEVQQAAAVNFNSAAFGEAGQEPAVVGKISVLKANQLSAPIKGNAGVYVVQITNLQPTGATYDPKFAAKQLGMNAAAYLPYSIVQNLRRNAKITDNRLRFF